MEKDFHTWSLLKSKTDLKSGRRTYHAGEIWWCIFGVNIGYEIDGKGQNYLRPILIVKGFSRATCVGIPLTTKYRDSSLQYKIDLKDNLTRYAVLSQIRAVDTKRLVSRIGFIEENELKEIKQALTRVLA